MTRALVLADLHLSKGEPALAPRPGDRISDQARVLDRVSELVRERDVDVVLLAGDVFDGPRPEPFLYRLFGDFLDSLAPVPVVSIEGNRPHGLTGPGVPSALDVFAGQIEHHRRAAVTSAGGLSVACLPWGAVDFVVADRDGGDRGEVNMDVSDLTLRVCEGLADEMLLAGMPRPWVLLAHAAVEGAAYPTGLPVDAAHGPLLPLADLAGLSFDVVAAGHIHKPQILYGADDCTVGYVGSPLPLDFSEANDDHGVWLIDDGVVEFVPVESRPLLTLAYDFSEFEPSDVDDGQFLLDVLTGGDDLTGAILRVRYEATEEQARRIDRPALEAALLDAGAWHVIVEPRIVREARARVAGLDGDVDDGQAFEMWLAENHVTGERADRLRDLNRSYLAEATS